MKTYKNNQKNKDWTKEQKKIIQQTFNRMQSRQKDLKILELAMKV